jgi:hypothetical protein
MARPCSICSDSRRAEVNAALTDGRTLRDVSKQFRISVSSLHRHTRAHLGRQLAEVAVAEAGTLLDRVAKLSRESARLGRKAEEAGDLRTALAAIRELTRLAELSGRLAGELREGGAAVNVAVAVGVGAGLKEADLDKLTDDEIREFRSALAAVEERRWPELVVTKGDVARMVEVALFDPEVVALLPAGLLNPNPPVAGKDDESEDEPPGGIPA